MHQCDLFSQEELNIENVYHYLRGNPYFAIMTVSIDQWHAGIGLFYGNVSVSIKVFNTNICLSSVCHNLFCCLLLLFIPFFCFYCVTEMLNSIQDQKKIKSFLFLVVTGM